MRPRPRVPATGFSHPLALLLLIACGSVPTELPPNPDRCGPENVRLAVSPGTAPTISWEPGCEIGGLAVVRVWTDSVSGSQASEAVWAIETTDERDPLPPPVRYGAAPPGFHTVWPAKPLLAGETYDLTIEVHARDPIGPVVQVGFRLVARLTFTL